MGRVKDHGLFKLVRNFLTVYLPVQRKSSPNTVNGYRIALDQFLRFVSETKKIPYLSVTFDMFSRELVDLYLDDLITEKHLSPATRNNRLAAIKSFLSYAAAADPKYIAIMDEVASIVSQKDDPFSKVDYMSEEAVSALLEAPDTTTTLGIRDQFFMILLYDTGGRIQELIDLRICDLKISSTSSVLLHGKGNVKRQVPIMESTVKHLKRYLSVFYPDEPMASQKYLFYTIRNGKQQQICDDTIRARMNIYADKAREKCPEVPDRVHPHLWRHSRAMHLYQHGMDLTLISQWLGHKQVTTTLVYAHADTEAKRKAIEKAMGASEIAPEAKDSHRITDDTMIKRLYGLK